MNGNRNHLPEVAFITQLKRHLGKKDISTALARHTACIRSLNTLVHSFPSFLYKHYGLL